MFIKCRLFSLIIPWDPYRKIANRHISASCYKKVLDQYFTILDSLSNFWVCRIPLELCSDHFSGWILTARGISKDPIVWLGGDRRPPKYVFKNIISSMNSKNWPTWTLELENMLGYFSFNPSLMLVVEASLPLTWVG